MLNSIPNVRDVMFDDQARNSLLAGVKKLAKAVKATLGPVGKNVVIKRKGLSPLITKDGVTVAREMFLADPFENLGAELVRSVASKTAEVAGDGTTTATVIAEAILEAGSKQLAYGANPADLKRGIDLAVQVIERELNAMAVPVNSIEQMTQVATVSANGDQHIGRLLAEVINKVGAEGIVTIEESPSAETVTETIDGFQFDRGYLNHYFITNPDRGEAVWEEPKILIYDGKLVAVKDIAIGNGKGFLERAAASQSPLVIICDELDGDALTAVVMNRAKSGLPILVVRGPSFGDQRKELLADIAAVVGTKVYSKHDKLNELDLSLLGKASKVVSTKDRTMILGAKGTKEAVSSRIASINKRLEEVSFDTEKVELKERLARLKNGIAVIKVGANSEVELKEKKDRVEDALYATQAAVKEGIVPGGGVALVRCLAAVKKLTSTLSMEEAIGSKIMEQAILSPLKQIVENGNQSPLSVLEKVLEGSGDFGYNAKYNRYENLLKTGVVDPVKVTKSALRNAAGVASLVLTTNVLIVEKDSKPEQFETKL